MRVEGSPFQGIYPTYPERIFICILLFNKIPRKTPIRVFDCHLMKVNLIGRKISYVIVK